VSSTLSSAELRHEILIIDDNSADGTDDVVSRHAAAGIPVALHVRLEDRGLGTAVVMGMRKARGDILVCMDADFSHPPEALPKLIRPLLGTNPPDFVVGSRYAQGGKVAEDWPARRRINSYIATMLSRPLLHRKIADPMAGFFALPAAIFHRNPNLRPIGFKIGIEIMLKCACRHVQEIAISFSDRTEGFSKLNVREQLRYLDHLSSLYDFAYPRLSSSLKYFVACAVGLILALALYAVLGTFTLAPKTRLFASYAGSLVAAAAFYWRYVIYNRPFIKSLHPLLEFVSISLLELGLIGYAAFELMVDSLTQFPYLAVTVLAVVGACIRFVGRKILGHDIRGPAVLRNKLEVYEYHEPELACVVCGNRRFTLPFAWKHPWMVKCTECGIAFAYPQPSDQALAEIYDEHYFDEWGSRDNNDALKQMKTLTFRSHIEKVARLANVKTMIDLGCGLGHSLDVAKELGWDAYGLEMNEAAIRELEKRHPGKVHYGTIESVALTQPFDLVCMLEVLEHVRDPLATLEIAKTLMHDSSLLMITTIDAGAYRARFLGEHWYHIHRAHLWYFTMNSLFRLFERAGFDVLLLQSAKKFFIPRYIFGVLEVKASQALVRFVARGSLKMLPRSVLDRVLLPQHEGVIAIARKHAPQRNPITRYLHVENALE